MTLAKKSSEQTKQKFIEIVDIAARTVASVFIPVALSVIVSFFATFIFHANDSSFLHNTWFFFSKLCFPSIPAMMWFIMKK